MNEPSEMVPEGYLIADDPALQYLNTHKEAEPGDLVVAETSEPLRAIYMTINCIGQKECLYDPGSMIVSMGQETAVQLGLTWDLSLCINMESASNHIEKTLGLARNVRFFVGGINVFLQVHILENPPYRVLLGRPFERFTACNSSTKVDGSRRNTKTKISGFLASLEESIPEGGEVALIFEFDKENNHVCIQGHANNFHE